MGVGGVDGESRTGPMETPARSRTPLRGRHRSKVPVHDGREEHEQDGQKWIEHVRDRADKDSEGTEGRERRDQRGIGAGLLGCDAHAVSDQRDFVTHPCRNGDQSRHGGGGRVDDVRELLSGDLETVGDRPHGVPDDQGVGVVVEEDGEASKPRGDLASPARAREWAYGVDDPLRAPISRDDPHQAAEQE